MAKNTTSWGWWRQVNTPIFLILLGINFLLYALLDLDPKDNAKHWWQRIRNIHPEAEWLDLYASHDPVCNGPVWEQGQMGEGYVSCEVVNHRSLIADHTSYWDNRAGFVSRVAMFLARVGKLEVALHQLKPGDTVLIDKEAIACGMRIGFVNDLVGLTWIFGLASLFLTGRKQLEPFGDFIRTHLSATTSNFGIELAKINVGERFLSMEPATITQVTYLALLVLLYFAARWIKEFWNGCGAAVLAQHNPIDVNIEILFAMCQSIAFSLGAWWLLNHAGVVLPPEWFALAGFVFGALWMFRLHRKVKFD